MEEDNDVKELANINLVNINRMNTRKLVGGMNLDELRAKRSSMRLGREKSFEGMGSRSYNNVKAYQAGRN